MMEEMEVPYLITERILTRIWVQIREKLQSPIKVDTFFGHLSTILAANSPNLAESELINQHEICSLQKYPASFNPHNCLFESQAQTSSADNSI